MRIASQSAILAGVAMGWLGGRKFWLWADQTRRSRRLSSCIAAAREATRETPVQGLFIAGVLAAGHDANRIFIENGRWHSEAIARCLQNRS